MSIIRRFSQAQTRPVRWVGSSKDDLLSFPRDVVHDLGVALRLAQIGEDPRSAKRWHGDGPGIYELREDGLGGTYRVVYWVRFGAAVYVLHCFQKKSNYKGETPSGDANMVRKRLQDAKKDYDENYASTKKQGGGAGQRARAD